MSAANGDGGDGGGGGGHPVAPGHHPLSRAYNVWCRFRNQRAQGVGHRVGYKQGIKPYGTFSTVEGFWHLYGHMLRADDLPLVDICVFQDGIKPAWEDEANATGGQWSVKLHRSITAYCWEGVLMALVGNQIETAPEDAIHGLFLSVRFKDTAIAVWNRTVEGRDDALTVASLRRAMELDDDFVFEFRAHGAAAVKPQHHYKCVRASVVLVRVVAVLAAP
jgi:translation initiation factor 4E